MESTKTYYHGTVKSYLSSIMSEGLIPNKNKWRATWLTPWGEKNGSVASTLSRAIYLTDDKEIAEAFAKGRADYLATKPGNIFPFLGGFKRFLKNKNAPSEITRGVVLKINLPEGTKLEDDKHASHGGQYGFLYRGVIKPEFIEVVEEL